MSGFIAESGKKYKSFVFREKSVEKIPGFSDIKYKSTQKWGKTFRDEGKLPKDTKLNKKKDELVKLQFPFD